MACWYSCLRGRRHGQSSARDGDVIAFPNIITNQAHPSMDGLHVTFGPDFHPRIADMQTPGSDHCLFQSLIARLDHRISLGGISTGLSPVKGSRYQFSSGSSKHSPTLTSLYPCARALSIMNCVYLCTVPSWVSCARPNQARTPLRFLHLIFSMKFCSV